MRTSDVRDFYRNLNRAARAIKVSSAAVAKWGDVVPYGSAMLLEEASGGNLRIDRSLYDRHLRPLPLPETDPPPAEPTQDSGREPSCAGGSR